MESFDWYSYYMFDKSYIIAITEKNPLEYYKKELSEHIESLPGWFKDSKVTRSELMSKINAIKALIKIVDEKEINNLEGDNVD